MRILRFAGCAAIMAVWCATLPAIDLAEIEAKLAAQDAQLAEQNDVINDLKAKLESGRSSNGDSPEAITSIQKNARVTIGGQVNTKYTFTSAKLPNNPDLATEPTRYKLGDLSISDAYLNVSIEVNDYFDAYASFDMQNGHDGESYNVAEAYWVRWKNLCNTGFGIKIGRDALVFGADGVGELGAYTAGGDGALELIDIHHNGWDVSGVTQITPYWEGLDGKLVWELSLMQNIYDDTAFMDSTIAGAWYKSEDKYRSRNYGIGTFSTRVNYTPIEDFTITLSLANYHTNGIPDPDNDGENIYDQGGYRKNNTVYGAAFNYRPAALKSLAIWGQWVHGRNVGFERGFKSHAFNLGASFDLRENLTWFVQGDYLRASAGGDGDRARAWAFYTGLQYSLPYGVSFELGWKHEWLRWTNDDAKFKGRADSIYGLVGFEF